MVYVKYPRAEAVSLSGKNGCDASWEVLVAAERGTGVAVTRIVRGTEEWCMRVLAPQVCANVAVAGREQNSV